MEVFHHHEMAAGRYIFYFILYFSKVDGEMSPGK